VHGKRLGKYEVLAQIGVGGMGEVYRARFAGPGGATKEVALKVINPHLDQDDRFLRMFLEEMRVAMAMTHRNIVQTFDAGQEGRTHYLVMEYVEGCSLRQLLAELSRRRQRLPLGLVVFIGMEVCSALAYAHSFRATADGPPGIVHRDISPANILLAAHGDVKLADFGVVRAAGQLGITLATTVKGKLSYMAPEQARGKEEARSDIFSLGAVLFEMIAHAPFRQDATLEVVRSGKLSLPSLLRFRPDMSRSLDACVRSCLTAAPSDRPPTAAVLRELLADELHVIQQQQGLRRDLHAELRDFLARATAPTKSAPGGAASGGRRGRAEQLANAVLQQALEVPTDQGTGLGPVETRSSAEAGPGAEPPSDASPGPLPPAQEGAPRRARSETAAPPQAADAGSFTARLLESPWRRALPIVLALLCLAVVVGLLANRSSTPAPSVVLAADGGLVTEDGAARGARESDARDTRVRPSAVAAADAGAPDARARIVLPQGAPDARARLVPPQASPDARPRLVPPRGSPDARAGSGLPRGSPDARAGIALPQVPPDAQVRPAARRPRRDQRSTPAAVVVDDGAKTVGASSRPVTERRRPDDASSRASKRRSAPRARPGSRRGPVRRARLDINAVPWTFVYVDGRLHGETPAQNIMVAPGTHQIWLVNRKRKLSKRFTVRLRPGQHLRRVVYLE
jgi:serine/threonine protein kinase